MAYRAVVIPIMIASPTDVSEERDVVRKIIHDWNDVHSRDRRIVLVPVGWDTHSSPELGSRPQELINTRILQHSDILIGLFWNRLGTPTGDSISGSVEEIQEHVAAGKPAMIYFSDRLVTPSQINTEQRSALESFKSECYQLGLVESFSTIENLREKFTKQLQLCLSENPYLQTLTTEVDTETFTEPAPLSLSQDAIDLLKIAAKSEDGWIRVSTYIGGTSIYSGETEIFDGYGKELARWQAAIQELDDMELVEPKGSSSYALTHKGWTLADTFE